MEAFLSRMVLPKELTRILEDCKGITVPESRSELLALAMGGIDQNQDWHEVAYDVAGKGRVVEATVAKCHNGIVINYTEAYLRRRDPDCMVIADGKGTDKQTYCERYGNDFFKLRSESFDWIADQELILMPFMAGGPELGYPALLVGPKNAGFFAAALADIQGFIPGSQLEAGYKPKAIIYLAPTFRHTHFGGRQMVVHNRLDDLYELFSYNLYPGPSAKKGVYGVLIKIGEEEGWVTAHGSTVVVITPYDNVLTIMHEGASGCGKSEMTEQIHRELDGRILLGENLMTSERLYHDIKETCELRPVTDDMALCHPKLQNGSRKLIVKDAEEGWFIRTDHIKCYGTDPYLEALTIHPKEPLIFFNYSTVPNATCLIWEHIMDAPGKPCPNPRVILPRRFVPNIVNEAVEIDLRSFGVRMPLCTKEHPTYGIMGLFHVLPPALAWLWRLVAPRGHNNPSITDTQGLSSEGVGSYWPFSPGRQVDQANLLLRQMTVASDTRYILVPNQHIGAYRVNFMPQWIAREYLARRGSAKFAPGQLQPARCSLLGYNLSSVKVDGTYIPRELLDVLEQPEVGEEGYDFGAGLLTDFFKKELAKFLTPALDPLGREIIECCLADAHVEDYLPFLPMKF
jgi:hypothetical protein